MRHVSVIATVSVLLLAAPALASWDGSVEASVQSAYLWRGMVVNDEAVLQPSFTLSQGGFSAGVWANVDLTGIAGHRLEPTEVDSWLAYTWDLEHVSFTLTAYDYSFPHGAAPSTQEIWAGVTWKTFFSPSLTVVRDVNEAEGTYLLFSGTQSLGLLRGPTSEGLVLSVNFGHATREYTRFYFPELRADHVNDYGVRLDWPVALGSGTLKIGVQYSGFTDGSVQSPGFEGDSTHFVGGLTYSVPFEL